MTEDDKYLIQSLRLQGWSDAADRIEELERDYKEACNEAADCYTKQCVAEAKLAKAVVVLKWYADFGNHVPQTGQPAITFDMGGRAEDVLRELGEYDD
jgi:hypothetical protein